MRVAPWILLFVHLALAEIESGTDECICRPESACPTNNDRKNNNCWIAGFNECNARCDEAAAAAKTDYESRLKAEKDRCQGQVASEVKVALEKCKSDSDEALEKLRRQCRADQDKCKADSDEALEKLRQQCRADQDKCKSDSDEALEKLRQQCRTDLDKSKADSDKALSDLKRQCRTDLDDEERLCKSDIERAVVDERNKCNRDCDQKCQTKINDAVREAVEAEKARCRGVVDEDAITKAVAAERAACLDKVKRAIQVTADRSKDLGNYKVIDPKTFPHYYFSKVWKHPSRYTQERMPIPRLRNWTEYDSAKLEGFRYPGGAPGASAKDLGLQGIRSLGYENAKTWPTNEEHCSIGNDPLYIIADPIIFLVHPFTKDGKRYATQRCTTMDNPVVLGYALGITSDSRVTIISMNNAPLKLWRFSLVGHGGLRDRVLTSTTLIITCGQQKKEIDLPSEINTIEQGTIWTFDQIDMEFGSNEEEQRLNCMISWKDQQLLDGYQVTMTHMDFLKM